MIPLASVSYLRSAMINFDSVADTPDVVTAFWFCAESGAHKVLLRSIWSVFPNELSRFGEYISLIDTAMVLRREWFWFSVLDVLTLVP